MHSLKIKSIKTNGGNLGNGSVVGQVKTAVFTIGVGGLKRRFKSQVIHAHTHTHTPTNFATHDGIYIKPKSRPMA